MAIANRSEVNVVRHFDERGLSFACLGYGRGARKPGVFVCTSGTAVANALPAVVEASMDHVPMLLLTADRPPELRATGANQTIHQPGIFGEYIRWFFDLPCPSSQIEPRFIQSTMAHASRAAENGPVHINCMYREPFGSSDVPVDLTDFPMEGSAVTFDPKLSSLQLDGGNTLVIAGGCLTHEALAARDLAARFECPFLSDVTSGLRGLAYDLQLMRDDNPVAETVIHVGGRIVSKRWLQFLDSNPPRHYVHLSRTAERIDPLHRVTQHVTGDLVALCRGLVAERLAEPDFHKRWESISAACLSLVTATLKNSHELTEPAVALAVASSLSDEQALFLGNSMPVRDMDTFGFWPTDRHVRVGANRGASGIDGLIGSAYGYSRALSMPTTLILGDLAFLHDVNSLAMCHDLSQPFVIIALNNDGGGIFHFLPIADEPEHFEQYFGTPHGLKFKHAAELFGVAYCNPNSMPEFLDAYEKSRHENKCTLIELNTNREDNLRLHRSIQTAVRNLRL